MTISSEIKAKALESGFSACGIARCHRLDARAGVLERWLAQGYNASMDYMAEHFEKRVDPSLLVENAKSAIVCLASYKIPVGNNSGIASYALYEDYHYTLKNAAKKLAAIITELVPESFAREFVDTAPVLERAWATEAGLGWTGRNSMLVNRTLGSFTFISVIITDAELEYDTPCAEDYCGTCRRCIDSCPTGAIRSDRTIDSNLCISYHTIESRNPIPEYIAGKIEKNLFGCDTCQNVCPWNAKSNAGPSPLLVPDNSPAQVTEDEWLAMGSGEFRRRFSRSPLSRAGLKKIKAVIVSRRDYIGIKNNR